MKDYLNVQSIFRSIDGEINGYVGAGQPSTFIRLRGCNLRCTYCDTVYALEKDFREDELASPGTFPGPMTSQEIIQLVQAFPGRKVTLTGGEPLFQLPYVTELIGDLLDRQYDITVETNGSIPIRRCGLHLLPRVSRIGQSGSVRFVVDYKLPSSRMEHAMDDSIWMDLSSYDVMKFVISDNDDYFRAISVVQDHAYCRANMVFSPAINPSTPSTSWPTELAERVALADSRISFSLQLHKILWPNSTTER